MIDKRNCKIVQDLFPSYIENLTDEETNKFIEEHLKECEECKKILENMKKDTEVNNKQNKIETNYIKKYSNKMKILKAILLVIFIIFIASTTRKFIIISKLSSKANKYMNSNNYYSKIYSYEGDRLNIVDAYYKDGKWLWVSESLSENGKRKLLVYGDNEKSNAYIEQNNEKIAILGQRYSPISLYNHFGTDNPVQLFVYSMISTVKETVCNGRECYYILVHLQGAKANTGVYIDKETGLVIRDSDQRVISAESGRTIDMVVDHWYEFDTVTDDIFIEPDLNEYTVQESN